MIAKAKEGKVVVRLKGGDPFLFGRGGEELETVRAAGIPVEMVPGISSALAVPASVGIPLTHRKYASQVTVLTGHEDPTKGESALDWQFLARSRGTIVVLMGVQNLPKIAEALRKTEKTPQHRLRSSSAGSGKTGVSRSGRSPISQRWQRSGR
jgi:uroporphyrin-III C-methyltransferase